MMPHVKPVPPARPVRVLHATECLATGTLQVLRNLTAALSHLGVEQTVVFSRRDETPADVPALFTPPVRLIEVARARGLHGHFIGELSRTLRREIRQWQPDHLHLHSSKAGFVGRLALLGLKPRPHVLYSPHGLSYLDEAKPLKNLVFRLLEHVANAVPSTPVGCGAGEAELLTQLTGHRAALLENPVDDAFFHLPPAERQGTRVVTAGRISRQKAPDVFAAVARQLRQRRSDVRMCWIGDGDPDGRALLEAAGCEVTGWKTRSELEVLLAAADVYLQTSRWEGLPISVIQAMAAGVPCVVTDVVGNRDAVTDGVSGAVASGETALLEALDRLLGDAALRSRLGRQARDEAARRFSSSAFEASAARLYGLPTEGPGS